MSCCATPLNRAWAERSRRPRHRAVSVSGSQGQSSQTQHWVGVRIQFRLPLTYHVRGHTSQVLVEVISFYNHVGQVSWVRAERIFDKFYELLRDARDPVKETVLITVGRIGRSGIWPGDFNNALSISQSYKDQLPWRRNQLPDISTRRP